MIVDIWLKNRSQPIEFKDVDNVYVKDSFFCILKKELNQVTEYSIDKIFRIEILQIVERYKSTNDMTIKINLETTQEPITRNDIKNTYTENGFYCLESLAHNDKGQELFSVLKTELYPLDTIRKVTETYY